MENGDGAPVANVVRGDKASAVVDGAVEKLRESKQGLVDVQAELVHADN